MDVVNRAGFRRATLWHTSTKHASQSTASECGTSTEELGEEVLRIHTAGTSTTFEAFFAILIVYRSLLGIGKDLISVRKVLEFIFSVGVVRILVLNTN